jgi:hydrogenase maturation protease
MTAPLQVLIVGIGSPHGDDQAGWLVADALQRSLNHFHRPHLACGVKKAVVPLDLLHWLEHVDVLILCDACQSDAPAGHIQQFPLTNSTTGRLHNTLPDSDACSTRATHGFDLIQVLQLIQITSGRLPNTTLWVISGTSFSPGSAISDPVLLAITRLELEILALLRSQ